MGNFWHNLDVFKVSVTSTNSHFTPSARELRSGCERPNFAWQCALGFALVFMLGNLAAFAANPATITFSFDFPHSDPERYSISVQSDGNAKYESSAKLSKDSEDDQNYQMDFTISDATHARIFDLAKQSHYFEGKVDSGNKKLAFTGAKKLTYKDDQHTTTAEYNFSSQPAVQQLTALFQSMAATLEFGRRLVYYHRYQKLALDDELKRMESQVHNGDLAELQAVKRILQEIYDDPAVIKVVRARALRIMEIANGSAVRVSR